MSMNTNAYILERTMNDCQCLLSALEQQKYVVSPEPGSLDVRVAVDRSRVKDFSFLAQRHLNEPYNYIDVQFPERKETILIFKERLFVIQDAEGDARARDWAIAQGLPVAESGWSRSW